MYEEDFAPGGRWDQRFGHRLFQRSHGLPVGRPVGNAIRSRITGYAEGDADYRFAEAVYPENGVFTPARFLMEDAEQSGRYRRWRRRELLMQNRQRRGMFFRPGLGWQHAGARMRQPRGLRRTHGRFRR